MRPIVVVSATARSGLHLRLDVLAPTRGGVEVPVLAIAAQRPVTIALVDEVL
jgi:hypothetical protein